MISIVHNEVQKAIEIEADDAGIALLIATLSALRENEHAHIRLTNDASGLSSVSPYYGAAVMGELILCRLPSEAWTDHS